MTRARAARTAVAAPAEPAGGVSAVRRPSALDAALDAVPDAGARAILASGRLLAIGPHYMHAVGAYVMAASWDGVAFRVYDACQDHRGTFAGWAAADRALTALGDEWGTVAR